MFESALDGKGLECLAATASSTLALETFHEGLHGTSWQLKGFGLGGPVALRAQLQQVMRDSDYIGVQHEAGPWYRACEDTYSSALWTWTRGSAT